ncbi:hypothetical protein [Absidia glauca]|uniref:EF-hand domain-containing protein n=1 Tax=Absidia glauca TaxID=4829 RepID=A0A168SWX9_ABSGL|nr:hypothetical protein [Absidia glauca]
MMPQENRITYAQFVHAWLSISKDRFDDESLYFSVLKKNSLVGGDWLTPNDFLPVLQDVVMNHPGLQFLTDNTVFQEKYIETVICRVFYDADCSNGKMTLKQFRKSQFTDRVKTLGTCTELNNASGHDLNQTHFYVIYCKFWTLDHDHDLSITASNLLEYNDRSLSPRIVHRIMQCGRTVSFARETPLGCLSFLDFIWFLLNEVDKTSPKAIEYWFRCMDEDGDGILSSYELEKYWSNQMTQQLSYNNDTFGKDTSSSDGEEDLIRFDDILRQMNDLIQPEQPGQFRLRDLKRNGYLAERFFDTFLHFNKFQLHESHQGCLRLKLQLELDKIRSAMTSLDQRSFLHKAEGFEDIHFGYLMFSDWADYAEAEYQQMLTADHQETKLEGSDDDDDVDDEPDVVDEYSQSHVFDDTSPLVLSSQPFYETDEECIDHTYDHTLLDNADPTDDTFQIDIGESGREGKAPSYYHSYYSYLSAGESTSDLGVKNDDDNNNRGEQPSDLDEDESDSTPSTPISSASKDEAPVLLDAKDEKRTPADYASLETAIEGSDV